MKILHVTDNYTPRGGVQQYVLSVAQLLAEHGHSNVVLYTEQSAHTIQDGDWPAYHINTEVDIVYQVKRVLGFEQPDVAYIHHVSSSELIEVLARMLPAVAYVHGFAAVCPGLGKYFRRDDTVCERPFGWGCVPMHYLRRCSAARNPRTLARLMHNTAALRQALLKLPRFLVGSRYMANLLAQNEFPPEKIIVLPPHFLPDNLRLTYTPPEEPESILYAGRLEIEKGFPYLLEALAELPGYVRLVVAGDGTQRARYEEMVRELGLKKQVEFMGWLDSKSMEKAFQRCGIVAMPSICPESFGKSGVEAQAHGRPAIAFNVGGISDWLHDGINGILVKPQDIKGLADNIWQLVRNEPLRTRLGQAAQASVRQQYAASRHLRILLQTFAAATEFYD